jgi:RNA polymerase sigma-70 factor (ECF subfamily)
VRGRNAGRTGEGGASANKATADQGVERVWVEGVRRGESAAFEAIVRAYGSALVRFAFGLVQNDADAEDVVQAVFWRIWERRAEWTLAAPLRYYLYTAVRNEALHRLRKEQTQRKHAVEARRDPEFGMTPHAAEALVARESMAALMGTVREAFLRLSERQQTALRLRYEEGRSYREIAAVLDVSESGVDQMLGRAMRILRGAVRRPEPE